MEFLHSFTHSSMAPQLFVGPWPLLQFRNLFYTVDRTPWTSDQPVARPLPTHRAKQIQNKRTHRHPCPIPVFERAKTVHGLDRAGTVIVMEFLIMKFSPASFYFLCLTFKYSPQCSILRHSQSVFFTYNS
jgi:hypothetical protein